MVSGVLGKVATKHSHVELKTFTSNDGGYASVSIILLIAKQHNMGEERPE